MSGERTGNDSISPECRRRGFAFASGMAAISADVRAIRAGLRGNVVTLFPDRGDRYISKGIFPAGG